MVCCQDINLKERTVLAMRHMVLVAMVTSLMVVAFLSIEALGSPVYRALLVTGGGSSLEKNDVTQLRQALLASSGLWKDENIKVLRNRPWNDIVKEIGTFLAKNADEDDVSLFFYTGHGIQRVDDNNDENQGGAANSLDEGFMAKLGRVYDDQFWNSFTNVRGQIIFVFEICHSGGLFQSVTHAGGSHDLAINNSIVLAACSETEESSGYRTLKHWAFPYFLIKGLTNQFAAGANRGRVLADTAQPFGQVTVKEWYDYASKATSDYVIAIDPNDKQTPQFDDVAYPNTFVPASSRVIFKYSLTTYTPPFTLTADAKVKHETRLVHSAGNFHAN